MAADEFEIEGPQSANALVAATAAQIANEPWADGYALVFAVADGKLHPVPIVPAGGAIVSVSGVAPISVSPGIAPIVSLTGIVGEANGGFGASALTFGTGLLKRTGAATYTTVTDTLTVTAGTGLSGGGAVSLGGSTSLSVSYGTTAGTATQGNDTRLAPAPSGAGKMLYDTGAAYSALTAGTTSQVLVGGSAPSFGSVPAAAITALTGTVSGTVTLSGAVTLSSATLGGNLVAGSNKVTGLAAGSAAGDSLRFEQGGGVPVCFYLNTAQGWTANNYLGIGGDGSSSVNVNIVPFPVPQAGTIKNLRVQGLTNAGTNTTITIYKASSAASPTYSATALTCLVSSGTATGNDTTHSVSVNAGDLLVAFSNATWSVNGCAVSFIYLPG